MYCQAEASVGLENRSTYEYLIHKAGPHPGLKNREPLFDSLVLKGRPPGQVGSGLLTIYLQLRGRFGSVGVSFAQPDGRKSSAYHTLMNRHGAVYTRICSFCY